MPVASKVTLKQFFTYCAERDLSFAFYRLPEEKSIKIVAQKNLSSAKTPVSTKQTQKGFLFAPFQEDKNYIKTIIEPDIFCDENKLPKLNFAETAIKIIVKYKDKNLKQEEATKTEFKKYLSQIQKEIRSNDFKKIVAARIVKKKKPKTFDATKFFQLLCEKHPHALVSLVHTKEYGLWIGASPEILLTVNGKFKTYSLAGTKANAKASWGKKEIEEQEIVSDYIRKTFSSFTKENPSIEGPKTITAGNLLHLRTTFTYHSIPHSKWMNVVEQLHPTPAVAGSPKEEAIDFILKNEKANRSFYSGYLGPVNLDKQINLFVNLRCMQVSKNKLTIYTGCGITTDSEFSKEWKETKIKSETLLSLLKKKK